jgi:hypothetical protein
MAALSQHPKGLFWKRLLESREARASPISAICPGHAAGKINSKKPVEVLL